MSLDDTQIFSPVLGAFKILKHLPTVLDDESEINIFLSVLLSAYCQTRVHKIEIEKFFFSLNGIHNWVKMDNLGMVLP